MNSLSLLMVGSEVLDGRTKESNSHFLIDQISHSGWKIDHVLSCEDSTRSINESLAFLLRTSTGVIISGGLGPTSDDLTRESVAEFSGCKLVLQGDVLGRLETYFRARQRPFDPSNCKQALFPEGSTILDNPVGSALGFIVPLPEGHFIACLPGIPKELQAMTTSHIIPMLKHLSLDSSVSHREYLKVFGLGESVIGSLVQQSQPDEGVEIAYRVSFPEVEVVFSGTDVQSVKRSAERASLNIGAEYVFSKDGETSLDEIVAAILAVREIRISVAESFTGGLIGAALTKYPGSSSFFLGGIQAYCESAKHRLLGVKKRALRTYGAVSPEVACEMAMGALESFGGDYSISATGFAGPGGGNDRYPVGTFFIGIAHERKVRAYRFFFNGPRQQLRLFATHTALETVRRTILNLPIREHVNPYVVQESTSIT